MMEVPRTAAAYQDMFKVEDGCDRLHLPLRSSGGGVPAKQGPFLLTRYEFAIFLSRVLDMLPRKNSNNQNLHLLPELHTKEPQMVAAMRRLVLEFTPELKELGVDMLAVNRLLAASFSDVSPTHWAVSSVKQLQQTGIITRYPDGTFKGNTAGGKVP